MVLCKCPQSLILQILSIFQSNLKQILLLWHHNFPQFSERDHLFLFILVTAWNKHEWTSQFLEDTTI